MGRQTQQHDRLRGQRDWILATPEIQHILVVEQGWSHDRYEAWLYMSLETSLLPKALALMS